VRTVAIDAVAIINNLVGPSGKGRLDKPAILRRVRHRTQDRETITTVETLLENIDHERTYDVTHPQ